jgi:MFS family permease
MASRRRPEANGNTGRIAALRFVLLIGILSFFADFTYEGSRSIIGPYLGSLGATATIVAIVTFADYPVIAYHFGKTQSVPGEWIAVFYAVAMAVSGAGSLLFGRLFDRFGFAVLIALTLISALFAPLVFLGGFWLALIGAAIWGLGMGVHESIIPAAVAPMVPVARRASAFGLFTAGYGVSWFLGSAAIAILYDRSVPATVAFCVAAELLAIPMFLWVGRRYRAAPHA